MIVSSTLESPLCRWLLRVLPTDQSPLLQRIENRSRRVSRFSFCGFLLVVYSLILGRWGPSFSAASTLAFISDGQRLMAAAPMASLINQSFQKRRGDPTKLNSTAVPGGRWKRLRPKSIPKTMYRSF